MASKRSVKDMADRLISTLDSMMPSDKADAIVRDVAEELYRDLLGIEGSIIPDKSQATGFACIGGSRGVKRQMVPIGKFKFEAK